MYAVLAFGVKGRVDVKHTAKSFCTAEHKLGMVGNDLPLVSTLVGMLVGLQVVEYAIVKAYIITVNKEFSVPKSCVDKVDVVYNLDKQNHKNNIGLQYLNKLLQKTNQKVVKKS